MREAFHAHVVGGGCDDIQDGGRKLIPTTHHPPHEHEKLPHYYSVWSAEWDKIT